MEIKITTQHLLKVLNVISWIIFIGLCIEAGGIIFNTFYVLGINPAGAHNFWKGIDLSNLLESDKGYFIHIAILMSIVAIFQAILFYLIVKTFHSKNVDLKQPFNPALINLISNSAYLAIGIGCFSKWGSKSIFWIEQKGIQLPGAEALGFGGADVWLFMGVTLLVIGQFFKRGAELQSENELTI